MNRRQLLGTSLSAGAFMPLINSSQAQENPIGQSVLIIGAGISGISAAQELQAKGHKVTVLEGRNRIGGRIFTSREWPDTSIDLGASWIHGVRRNPLTAIADEIGAERVATDSDAWLTYDVDGKIAKGMDRTWSQTFRNAYAALRQVRRAGKDMPVMEALKTHIDLDAMSATERRRFLFLIRSELELGFASSLEELSSLHLDDGKEFSGDEVVFPQGYAAIIEHLAKGIDIKLNEIATDVRVHDSGVTVVTKSNQFEADRVVITLPIGVLKQGDVTFDPPLPEFKQKAIQQIGTGLLNKVALKFPRCFWQKKIDWIGMISDEPGRFPEWLSLERVFGKPVLVALVGASFARELESDSNESIVEQAMQVLKKNYGPEIPSPTGIQITRWASDPFSRCAYSSPVVGMTSNSRKELAAPINNRLFFAGEATSNNHPSTVHGALLSGQHTAREIQKL